MTLLFVDGFDTQDTASPWLRSNGSALTGSYSSSTRFATGYCKGVSTDTFGSWGAAYRAITSSAKVTLGCAINFNGVGPNFVQLIAGGIGGTVKIAVNFTYSSGVATGTVVANGSTVTTTSAIPQGWHYVELSGIVHPTTGYAAVRIDGANYGSTDFNGNTGTAVNIDAVGVGLQPSGNGSTNYYDDVYCCDGLGSINNGFLGDSRVYTVVPSAAGSATQLTPTGTANNWDNVNNPASYTQYNGSPTVGQRDTYTLGDLPAGAAGLKGLQVSTVMFKSDSGAASMKPAVKSSATVSYGATRALATSATKYADVFETDPNTSAAWTASGVNALEAGAEVA